MSAASLYVLAYLLMNIIQQTMFFYAFQAVIPAKLPPRYYYPLVVATSTGSCLLTYYPLSPYPTVRILFSTCYLLLLFLLLHRGKLLRKFILTLAIFLTMTLTEMVTLLLAPSITVHIQHRDIFHLEMIPYYIMFLLTQAFFLFLLVYRFRALDKKNENRIADRDRLHYALFPVNQFVLVSVWFHYYVFYAPEDTFTPAKLLFIAAVILFSILTDVLLFRLIGRTAENAELRARNELMAEQIAVKSEYYRLTAQNYSSMRQMRHDIANHICTIHTMLQSGEKDAAEKYVAELEETTAVRSLLSDCQNTALDAFLRERAEHLGAQNIPVAMDIHLPPECFVSDVDLITAFGNLLDNAADACKQAAEPYIQLKAALADGFLHIETENSYAAQGAKKQRRISYMERGTGVSILNSLAQKYGGSFTSRASGTVYNNTLILKEPPHDHHISM